MPGAKDNQPRSIAEKYSLDYYRRPLSTRSWKSPWNWTFLMIALVSVAGLYFARGKESFQAAPVSSAHATFGASCSECHDRPGRTAWRLATLNDVHHSVSDAACQKCHSAAEHVPGVLAESACVDCHQEHRPQQSLTQLADSNCTRCHGNLHKQLATVSVVPTVVQFTAGEGGHPEVALLRASHSDVGPRHQANQVAAFKSEAVGASGGRWLDRGGIKFNHHLHVNPAGVMGPDGKPTTLHCANCHLPDDDGAYMQAVNYEQHCATCHPLRLAGSLASVGEIPHGGVEQVRGTIRERLSQQIQQAKTGAAVDGGNLLPLLPAPAQLTVDQRQDVDARMADVDHAVFGLEAKGMCRHCHHVEPSEQSWQVLVFNPTVGAENAVAGTDVESSMVPGRWLLHGAFHHQAHRAMECETCHAARDSSETTDILLPSIAVCRDCHGAEVTRAATAVRDDCVLCHTYHEAGAHSLGVPNNLLFLDAPAKSAETPAP